MAGALQGRRHAQVDLVGPVEESMALSVLRGMALARQLHASALAALKRWLPDFPPIGRFQGATDILAHRQPSLLLLHEPQRPPDSPLGAFPVAVGAHSAAQVHFVQATLHRNLARRGRGRSASVTLQRLVGLRWALGVGPVHSFAVVELVLPACLLLPPAHVHLCLVLRITTCRMVDVRVMAAVPAGGVHWDTRC
eukprot:scaffold1206_cov388-Prasinococcus_capsulatus_cf.AAC.59